MIWYNADKNQVTKNVYFVSRFFWNKAKNSIPISNKFFSKGISKEKYENYSSLITLTINVEV